MWIAIDRNADRAYGPFEKETEAREFARRNFHSWSVTPLYKPPITKKKL